MKYIINVNIDRQEDVNLGLKDASGSALPPKIENFNVYKALTDINTTGSAKLTLSEIESQIRTWYVYSSSLVSEKMYNNRGVEITGTGSVNDVNLSYVAILPQFTGSASTGSASTGSASTGSAATGSVSGSK